MKKKKTDSVRKNGTVFVLFVISIFVLILFLDETQLCLYLIGDNSVETAYGEPYVDPGAHARLKGKIFGEWYADLPFRIEGSVDTGQIGTTTLRYSARFLLQKCSCERSVTVTDLRAPVITLSKKNGYQLNWMDAYEEEGYTAIDDLDGDVTDLVKIRKTEDGIFYTVSDSTGNEACVFRSLDYSATKPEIHLKGEEEMYVSVRLGFQEPGYSAADSFGNDLTDLVQVEGSIPAEGEGTGVLTYVITNKAGERVEKSRRVTIGIGQDNDSEIRRKPTIYLSFDDGPGPYTGRLLDILAKYGVKATFFVTCVNPEYSDCIGRAFREGHAIGVHSATHEYEKIYASEEAFFDDFNLVEELIFAQTGEYTDICRLPGGSSNTISEFNPGIMSRLASDLIDQGYRYFDWNVPSGDTGETVRTTRIYENVVYGMYGKWYPVVLQHDTKDYSVAAVESIILWGLRNGYTFDTLKNSELTVHLEIVN